MGKAVHDIVSIPAITLTCPIITMLFVDHVLTVLSMC